MRIVYLVTFFVGALSVSILGLRGRLFTQPPADVFPEFAFPGMKYQPRYHAQGESAFFADGMADRMPPPHTVPADYGPAGQPWPGDEHLYLGKNADGTWARGFPASITVDLKLLQRGQ